MGGGGGAWEEEGEHGRRGCTRGGGGALVGEQHAGRGGGHGRRGGCTSGCAACWQAGTAATEDSKGDCCERTKKLPCLFIASRILGIVHIVCVCHHQAACQQVWGK